MGSVLIMEFRPVEYASGSAGMNDSPLNSQSPALSGFLIGYKLNKINCL
jgi:hypothetical protein